MSSLERFSCREKSQFGSHRAGRQGVAALCALVSGQRGDLELKFGISLVPKLLSSVQNSCLICRQRFQFDADFWDS